MALTKEQKKQIIEDLEEKIDRQKSVVFVGIANLKAKDLLDLRNQLKESNCLLAVIKKTLLKIACQEKNMPLELEKLEGETALIFGFGDELSPAKISDKFTLGNENLKILGGIFENEFIDKDKVIALARIPSREELLAKMVGSIKAPIAGFVNALEGNIKGLLYALNQLAENKK